MADPMPAMVQPRLDGAGRVLAFAAVVEVATGLALMIDPALMSTLLVGAEAAGAGAALGRCFGIALLALGVACRPRDQSGAGGSSALRAMLVYNLLIALYLGYLGTVGQMAGLLLWPAVALHAVVAALLAGMPGRGQLVAKGLSGCVLGCVLAAANPAIAQSPPVEPTPDQVNAFLHHQGDPVVGAWIARQLQDTGDEPQPGSPPDAAPASGDLVEEEEASVAGFLAGRLHLVEQHFAGLAAALPTLPGEFAAAGRRLIGELSDRGLAEVAVLLVAFVGLGFGAEWLFGRAIAGPAES